MPRYMLDTNACITIRRNRPASVRARLDHLAPGDAVMSVVTFGELRYGAEKGLERDRMLGLLDELVELLPVAPLDQDVGAEYGSIRAELARRGELIGPNDLWVAAHAMSLGLTLVTNNVREFRRVAQLDVEDWMDS